MTELDRMILLQDIFFEYYLMTHGYTGFASIDAPNNKFVFFQKKFFIFIVN